MIMNALKDRLMLVAICGVMLMGAGIAVLAPFQSIIGIERLGFSDVAYAAIVTSGALVSVVASVWIGIYTDQTGQFRFALLGALCVGLLAGLLMFIAPSRLSFLIVHVVLFPIGATAFTQYFAIAAVAANENPSLDRTAASTLVRAVFSAAFAATPVLWSLALARGVDVLGGYAIIAATNICAILAVLALWKGDTSLSRTEKSGKGLWASLAELTDPGLLVRLLLICTITASNGLYNFLLGLLILNNLGGTDPDVALFAGVVALIEIPVMLLMVPFLRNVSTSALILIGAVIYAAFLMTLGLMPSIHAAWWLAVPAGIGAGILLSLPIGYVQNLVAARAGAGSGLVSMTHFGGMIFASGIFAGVTVFTGYQGVAVVGGCLAVVAGLFLYGLDRRAQT